MKIQLIALSLCVLASTNLVKGQEHSKGFTPSENKHEIRLSVSDGLTQGSVDILGMGLADAVTGSKRTDENYSLVYGFGYCYSLGRFKVGTDLGFSTSNSKLALAGEQAPSLKESNVNFMILLAAEFVYYIGYSYRKSFGDKLLLLRLGVYNVVGNPSEEDILSFYSVHWSGNCLPYGSLSFKF